MPLSLLEVQAKRDANFRFNLAQFRIRKECERIEEMLERIALQGDKGTKDDDEGVQSLRDLEESEAARNHALLEEACKMFATFIGDNRHLAWDLIPPEPEDSEESDESNNGVECKPFPKDLLLKPAMAG